MKHANAGLYERLSYAVAWVRGRADALPQAAVILGSGLGGFADRLGSAIVIPYDEIPELPTARIPGHAGRLVIGDIAGPDGPITVAAMQGRVHVYEGWTAEEAAFGARVLCMLGVRLVIVTNAAGGVNPEYAPGDLVRITDHLNLSGANPLRGVNDERLGPRFPDMSAAYDSRLGSRLDETAARLGVPLRRGVYACLAGPSYETPAEIRMLRTLGADLVGMSTVPEVVAARHMDVPVVGVSLVANRAAGLSPQPLSHADVATVAARESERLGILLTTFLGEVLG